MSVETVTRTRKPMNFDDRARLLKKVEKMTPEQRKRILELYRPRMVEEYMAHIPHPKQQVFLGLRNKEAMYGGAAGGGKSDAILMAALQYVDVPGYSALILRRTWPDLSAPGAILDRANTWLSNTSAEKREGGRIWRFPSGARLTFGTIQYDADVFKYQSAEYQFIGFDELTQFQQGQYTYMFSRIRRPQLVCITCGKPVKRYGASWKHTNAKVASTCKVIYPDPKVLEQYPAASDGTSIFNVPLRMRAATNPGGRGHEWVRSRFVDPRTADPDATFIPALLTDNPSLDQESYAENLQHLLPTDRERLLAGDWDIVEEGEMFDRSWFKPLEPVQLSGPAVRFWDMASTSGGGDWTVGTRLRLTGDGKWVVEDVVRGQWSPLQKEQIIRQTAVQDGVNVSIRMEQEPGSSGVDVIDNYRRKVLVGFDFDGVRSSGDKTTRATPLASAANAGNVYIFPGLWNKAFLDEFSVFPVGNHDDIVDSVSGGMNFLAFGRQTARVLV